MKVSSSLKQLFFCCPTTHTYTHKPTHTHQSLYPAAAHALQWFAQTAHFFGVLPHTHTHTNRHTHNNHSTLLRTHYSGLQNVVILRTVGGDYQVCCGFFVVYHRFFIDDNRYSGLQNSCVAVGVDYQVLCCGFVV